MNSNSDSTPEPTEPTEPAEPNGPASPPAEKYIELTPGEPVSFEVPPNTNLVVNVIGKQGSNWFSSLLSSCGCVVVGLVVLMFILYAIGSLSH